MNDATIPARLRPMTETEREAVELHDSGTPMWSIRERTGLTSVEIAAAVELRTKFGQILGPAPDAPAAPVIATVANGFHGAAKPAKAAETKPIPAPAKPVATPTPVQEPVEDDIATLIEAGASSPQARARELAAQIRQCIATLRTLLPNDEKVRKLNATAEVLRKHLAETEAELAALLDTANTAEPEDVPEPPADNRPEIVIDVEPFQPDETPAAAPELKRAAPRQKPDPLAYSPDVRAWARNHGWPELGTYGRMPGAILTAYRNAHPTDTSTEAAQ